MPVSQQFIIPADHNNIYGDIPVTLTLRSVPELTGVMVYIQWEKATPSSSIRSENQRFNRKKNQWLANKCSDVIANISQLYPDMCPSTDTRADASTKTGVYTFAQLLQIQSISVDAAWLNQLSQELQQAFQAPIQQSAVQNNILSNVSNTMHARSDVSPTPQRKLTRQLRGSDTAPALAQRSSTSVHQHRHTPYPQSVSSPALPDFGSTYMTVPTALFTQFLPHGVSQPTLPTPSSSPAPLTHAPVVEEVFSIQHRSSFQLPPISELTRFLGSAACQFSTPSRSTVVAPVPETQVTYKPGGSTG